jgi:parvulin-like peptidyl-prolyl isomerase
MTAHLPGEVPAGRLITENPMRRIVFALVLAATVCGPGALFGQTRPGAVPELPSGIAARVNHEAVTWEEADKRLGSMLEQARKGMPKEKFFQEAMRLRIAKVKDLVIEKLITQKAAQDGVIVSEAELEGEVQAELKRVGTMAKLRETVAQDGYKWEDYLELLRRRAIRTKVVKQMLGMASLGKQKAEMPFDVFVTPRESRDYYELHKAEYSETAKVRLRRIVIEFGGEAEKADARTTAEKAWKEIMDGADFAEVHSSVKTAGGLSDWLKESDLQKEEQAAIAALNEGAVSDPFCVETQRISYFCISKVEGRRGASSKTFEDVDEQIRKFLHDRRVSEAVNRYLRQLADEAYIWPGELAQNLFK